VVWAGNDGAAVINFDAEERAGNMYWATGQASILDAIRGWLGI
jgi:hypothetical protein